VSVSDRSAPEGSDDTGPKAKGPSAAAYPINWIVHRVQDRQGDAALTDSRVLGTMAYVTPAKASSRSRAGNRSAVTVDHSVKSHRPALIL